LFDALGDKLSNVFDNLTGRGALSEKDVSAAMREIRVALLEADVALPVVKDFIENIKAEAVGEENRQSPSLWRVCKALVRRRPLAKSRNS